LQRGNGNIGFIKIGDKIADNNKGDDFAVQLF